MKSALVPAPARAPSLLDRLASCPAGLPLCASSLEVLTDQGPEAFHRLLRTMLREATRRISLASLYLGTGKLEQELVGDLRHALERHPQLEVRLVMDHSRGRRKTENGTSASFLAGLVREFPRRVEVFLHRMPQLDGAHRLWPSPLDECIAVCHFKALVVDDTAILTGANLSDEYFHCRQARYVIVRDPRFAELGHGVVATTSRHSLRVRPGRGGEVALEPCATPATGLGEAILARVAQADRRQSDAHDTVLVPVFQHPALGLQQERELLLALLAWPDGDLVVTTPYTNFPRAYVEALQARLRGSRGHRTLLIAPSDDSHSFTTGRGLKALVPGIYLERERELVAELGPAAQVLHYHRPGWVFHAKGVWFTTRDETATVIGSSSFGERSVARDFDLSCLIVTRDPRLRRALDQEVVTMLGHARARTPSSRPGNRASQLLSPLLKPYL